MDEVPLFARTSGAAEKNASQILGPQPRVYRDSCGHLLADLLAVVNCENRVDFPSRTASGSCVWHDESNGLPARLALLWAQIGRVPEQPLIFWP